VTPNRPRLADVDAATLIREGRLPEKTHKICLAADLVAEWEALDERRRALVHSDSLASPVSAIVEQMRSLEADMAASTVTFKLRALPRRRWRELTLKHPPRKNPDGSTVQRDLVVGVNYEQFFDALLKESIIEPELDEDTLELLLNEKLTDKQWEVLTDVAFLLNRAKVDIPFLSNDSANQKTSEIA